MHYTLRQLEVFVAVAQHESVSHAARALAMSQSATSTALAELEPDDLTPREALEALYRLKALSRSPGPGRR